MTVRILRSSATGTLSVANLPKGPAELFAVIPWSAADRLVRGTRPSPDDLPSVVLSHVTIRGGRRLAVLRFRAYGWRGGRVWEVDGGEAQVGREWLLANVSEYRRCTDDDDPSRLSQLLVTRPSMANCYLARAVVPGQLSITSADGIRFSNDLIYAESLPWLRRVVQLQTGQFTRLARVPAVAYSQRSPGVFWSPADSMATAALTQHGLLISQVTAGLVSTLRLSSAAVPAFLSSMGVAGHDAPFWLYASGGICHVGDDEALVCMPGTLPYPAAGMPPIGAVRHTVAASRFTVWSDRDMRLRELWHVRAIGSDVSATLIGYVVATATSAMHLFNTVQAFCNAQVSGEQLPGCYAAAAIPRPDRIVVTPRAVRRVANV